MALILTGGIVSSYLGDDGAAPKPLGTVALLMTDKLMFHDTQTSMLFPQAHMGGAADPSGFKVCKGIIMMNGDFCPVYGWVIYQAAPHAVEGEERTEVGRIMEILRVMGSNDHRYQRPSTILIETWDVGARTAPYHMPQLTPRGHPRHRLLLRVQDLLCTVNTQHNCARHNCLSSGARVVRQERERTEQTIPQVEHRGDPRDYVLNLCQMRDASLMAHFHAPRPPLNREDIILKGAAMEVAPRTSTRQPGQRPGHPAPRGRARAGMASASVSHLH
ncbi:hypothetical protein JB92DRAFT_3130476 [Gautieria morchelliformis]|nr:hypothetical protein JB92DRAFT_3130476 [Gautieria morchelliformis]